MEQGIGPQLEYSDQLHAEKYRGKGESFREAMNRVASVLKEDDDHFKELREILLKMRFLPGGRIQSAIGSIKRTTPYNCYVSGTIEDSFIDGHGSIMERAKEAAATMRMGGGIGYDFSTLRPRGSTIRKLNSQSSGPVSFMEIFDAICRCVASSGHRRGAQMGVLRVDHPDIEEFIHAKQNGNRLTGFNISIAMTDRFMNCVETGEPFPLRFGAEVYKTIDAKTLFETIMRSTWDWAEPGVLFIDTVNKMNNLAYCEYISATNPCGEQPLPPYGACLLGSFNLVAYLSRQSDGTRFFDYEQLFTDIPLIVAAMDNVIDVATYPLFEQEKEAKSKRRMGLGVTGLANALEALGHPYGSESFVKKQRELLREINERCYQASTELAQKKGAFPLFKADQFMMSRFARRLRDPTIERIRKFGMRNSHLTSIAPTGTISLCADNISSGIEPVFSYNAKRVLITADGPKEIEVEDYGKRVFGVDGKQAADVTIDEHLQVLIAASEFVDSAVSKTCNVPSTTPWSEFKKLYMDAWRTGCKGCTTFQTGGKRQAILTAHEPSACAFDQKTGRMECT